MLSNKLVLALVALLILSVVIESTLSSPTAQDSRSLALRRTGTSAKNNTLSDHNNNM